MQRLIRFSQVCEQSIGGYFLSSGEASEESQSSSASSEAALSSTANWLPKRFSPTNQRGKGRVFWIEINVRTVRVRSHVWADSIIADVTMVKFRENCLD